MLKYYDPAWQENKYYPRKKTDDSALARDTTCLLDIHCLGYRKSKFARIYCSTSNIETSWYTYTILLAGRINISTTKGEKGFERERDGASENERKIEESLMKNSCRLLQVNILSTIHPFSIDRYLFLELSDPAKRGHCNFIVSNLIVSRSLSVIQSK